MSCGTIKLQVKKSIYEDHSVKIVRFPKLKCWQVCISTLVILYKLSENYDFMCQNINIGAFVTYRNFW